MSRYKPRGWFGEPHKHSLAAKGISTKHNYFKYKDFPTGSSAKERWMNKFKQFEEEESSMLSGNTSKSEGYKVVDLGDTVMLYDENIGEYLIGYSFDSVEEAKQFGKETGNNVYMADKRSAEIVADMYDSPDMASIYSGEQFDAVLGSEKLTPLAWESGVRIAAIDRDGNLLLYTEGDYDIIKEPSSEQIQRVLQTYDKRTVTPAGEQRDSRFKRDSTKEILDNQGLNAQSLALGLSDDEERLI